MTREEALTLARIMNNELTYDYDTMYTYDGNSLGIAIAEWVAETAEHGDISRDEFLAVVYEPWT